MSAFEESGARERDKAWGEMTPVDGGVWARRKLADAYFMACYDRRGLLLTIDSARAAAVASLEKALRELRDAAQAFRGNKPYRESDPTEQPLLDALMAADRLLDSAPSPVREPEGLDVERLDRSMAAAGVHIDKARPGPTREIGCQSCREGIAAIAAEYARLSPERPADEALP